MTLTLQESMEAIAFQTNAEYPKRVTKLFQQAMTANGELHLIERYLNEIAQLTLDATGIRFKPYFTKKAFLRGPYHVAAMVPNLNALSPLNPRAEKLLAKFDLDNMNGNQIIDGYVDLKMAKVGGFFSKLTNEFLITPSFFDGYFTAGEVAGFYFHELGHCYTYYEYLGQTLITNYILAEVVGRMDNQETLEKRMWVGKAALRLAEVDKSLREDVTSAEVVAMVLEGQVTRMQRALNTRWYDQRMAEAVADQFAARWGMGVDLARGLTKLERSAGIFAEAGYEPKWFGLMMNFSNIVALPFATVAEGAAKVLLATIKRIATTFAIGMATNSFTFFALSSGYTTLPQRIAALRRELVTVLKDRSLDDAFRKRILAEIDELDKLLEEKHEWSDVFGKITRYSLDAVIGRGKEIGQQELTEELANNRLYQLSAALKG